MAMCWTLPAKGTASGSVAASGEAPLPARIGLLDARLGTMALAEAGDFEAGDLARRKGKREVVAKAQPLVEAIPSRRAPSLREPAVQHAHRLEKTESVRLGEQPSDHTSGPSPGHQTSGLSPLRRGHTTSSSRVRAEMTLS